MTNPASITPAIVDALYEDALLLAEEARIVFERGEDGLAGSDGEHRVSLSCEALRTTTRLMHAMAWLINQRAFFAGDMSEFQLRRHGRLPPAGPDGDPAHLAMLDDLTRSVVERSRRFQARVARLDRAWRDRFAMQPAAVLRLRDRLGQVFNEAVGSRP
ncbi:MAG: DUF1465 family protein [Alteraurantiacibacter sp.]